jgi:hypothetical protein
MRTPLVLGRIIRRLVPAWLASAARLWPSPRTPGRDSGALTVEYGLCMLIAAAILMGVEADVFRPMAKEILKEFMGFIAPPYP